MKTVTMTTVSMLYYKPLMDESPRLTDLIGVYSDQVAARAAVDRYRDGCAHPPAFDQFIIIEKPVMNAVG